MTITKGSVKTNSTISDLIPTQPRVKYINEKYALNIIQKKGIIKTLHTYFIYFINIQN